MVGIICHWWGMVRSISAFHWDSPPVPAPFVSFFSKHLLHPKKDALISSKEAGLADDVPMSYQLPIRGRRGREGHTASCHVPSLEALCSRPLAGGSLLMFPSLEAPWLSLSKEQTPCLQEEEGALMFTT